MKRIQIINKRPPMIVTAAILALLMAIILIPTTTSCTSSKQTLTPTSPQPSSAILQPSSTPPRTPAPVAQPYMAPGKKITATMDDFNSLIFHIQGSVPSPGNVIVQYGSQGIGPFITPPVPTNGTTFSVEITRLRAATKYNYEVFLAGSSNTPVSQYQGTFTTGLLPPELQKAQIQLIQGTPTYDLLLMEFNCTNFNGIVAVDGAGKIVWYYKNDNSVFTFDLEANHNLVFNDSAKLLGTP